MNNLCSDGEMEALMTAMQAGDDASLAGVDRLLGVYPEDARLHFLRGSVLAGIGRSIEALSALRNAVQLAPDFAIARFQLGFFQLTSGEPAAALGTWGPLALLPEGNYLRMFVAGLTHLIRDEFEETVRHLTAGIAANMENAPLNRDMQLIVDQVRALVASEQPAGESGTASATSFLLDQLAAGRTTH